MEPYKVVPASGERDRRGRKKRKPKKYDGPFALKKVTQKESIAFVGWMVDEKEKEITDLVIRKEMSINRASKIMNHYRTLRRLVNNLEKPTFEEAIKPPIEEDKQGYLF